MITKLILPWFGGAAGVWPVCQLFFQVVLLLGYLYAHIINRYLKRRHQAVIHTAFLAASLLVLPIVPSSALKPSGLEDPMLRILLVLTVTVGLPYFVLSSTSPLLQAWYSRSRPSSAPYRLYALSNAGSLLALLSYPFLVEPLLSNHHQAISWSIVYSLLTLLTAAVAFCYGADDASRFDSREGPAVEWKIKLLWLALAACASAILLAITNYISQNIAAVPFVWVIPLSLYLLTFILCFEGHRWYRRKFFLRLFAVALAAMAYALGGTHGNLRPTVLICVFCIGLFACCMVCHGELAQLKPHSSQLTSFYLLVSLGGSLGAFFVALVAPHIFSGFYELPIALGCCGVLIHVVLHRDSRSGAVRTRITKRDVLASALVVALCVNLYVTTTRQTTGLRMSARNFFGILRVEENVAPSIILLQGNTKRTLDGDPHYRELVNGTIEHGIQFLDVARRQETTTYYGPKSGVGLALVEAGKHGPIKVGVVGLGAGTLAAYGRPGDQYTFYEINSLVVTLAKTEFTFVGDSQAQVGIVVGDGRLSLEREPAQQFDVLVIDAFSGDAIPTHLLTREAFDLYLHHLSPTGIIAVHISNRYLNLAPVVTSPAVSLNRKALLVDSRPDNSRAIYAATWVLIGDKNGVLGKLDRSSTVDETRTSNHKGNLWTDDYSSVLKSFK
jgi:hypothetical protein